MKGLLSGKLTQDQNVRYISGDPLMGKQESLQGFLGYHHFGVAAFQDGSEREMLHFVKIGSDKFTATKAYLSGFFNRKKPALLNTQLHGEERPFIDGSIYDRVMPIRIPVMHLTKAVLAEDFDLAEKLGILEVVPEDFSLPTFICPSKIELVEILAEGQRRFIQEIYV
jgi:Na+-transporting NADH:ubiquinone oxidoreductase subunit A